MVNIFGEIKDLLVIEEEQEIDEDYIVYILELIEKLVQTPGMIECFDDIIYLLQSIDSFIMEEFGFSREAERMTIEILISMLNNLNKETLIEKSYVLNKYTSIA